MTRVHERVTECIAMGVPYVWVLDPETKQVFTATAAAGLQEVKSGVLRTEDPALEVPLNEILR